MIINISNNVFFYSMASIFYDLYQHVLFHHNGIFTTPLKSYCERVLELRKCGNYDMSMKLMANVLVCSGCYNKVP